MSVTPVQVAAGQAVYTMRVLGVYDFMVLGVSNRWLWQCPTPRLVAHYHQHITANHLDVGVGTGYFLDHCRFPSEAPRIALLDLNQNALEFAAQRLARYQPETYRHDALEPISLEVATFDSIGINYLLHCLPGSLKSKAVAFDHLKALMNPDAVLFGSTLLQGGVSRRWWAKRLMDVYNQKRIFSNQHDSLDGLKCALHQRFRDVSVDVIGCAALFAGRL
jgi:2-polyprenyl-3-methyl-5-hydroxy-6-metoxy-1,4-benzoquinol methylase